MASPIGHSLVGGILFLGQSKPRKLDWPLLAFCVVFANAPDLDIVPGLLGGDLRAFHRGASHSIVFGAMVALPVAFILKKYLAWFADYSYIRLFLLGFVLFLSHLAVDLVTLDNGFPFGMPLLWPLSSMFISLPFYLIPNVLHSNNVLSLHNTYVAVRELVLFGAPFLYFVLVNGGFLGYRNRAGFVGLSILVGFTVIMLVQWNPFF